MGTGEFAVQVTCAVTGPFPVIGDFEGPWVTPNSGAHHSGFVCPASFPLAIGKDVLTR